MFAWNSSFLRRHFVGKFVMEDSGKRKDDVTMHLPGVSKQIVTALVGILIKGEATNVTNPVKKFWVTQFSDKEIGISIFELELFIVDW